MGAAAAALGVITVALAWGLTEGTATGGPGTRFLPTILGGLMVLLGAMIAFGPARVRPAGPAPAGEADAGRSHGRALATVAVMGASRSVASRESPSPRGSSWASSGSSWAPSGVTP